MPICGFSPDVMPYEITKEAQSYATSCHSTMKRRTGLSELYASQPFPAASPQISEKRVNALGESSFFVLLHLNMTTEKKYIYSQPVLDFITVSTEYCKYLEQCQSEDFASFTRVMLGILPMIYLKMTLIGEVPEVQGWNEAKLTEEDYNYIQANVAAVMADKDDFLDVFVEDFKYSEHPVLCTVSENLADIYQQLREMVETFREGCEESMEVALYDVAEEFRLQWGQKLLNALRAIHDATYHQ